MKKLTLLTAIFSASAGILFAQQAALSAIQTSKAELLSLRDIKSLITSADQATDYSEYVVDGFKLVVNLTETTPQGVVASTYTEPADGSGWTEKQRALVEKYGKTGADIKLEGVVMRSIGKPGTPYVPGQEKIITLSAIPLLVKE